MVELFRTFAQKEEFQKNGTKVRIFLASGMTSGTRPSGETT